jgi:hypothetical protein
MVTDLVEGPVFEMRTSGSLAKLGPALAAAQSEMKPALLTSINPAFKNRYANLASMWDAIRGPLGKHKIAVVQAPVAETGWAGCITVVTHEGEWIASKLLLPVAKADAQGHGSAITYARRYTLAMVGVVGDDDDDGEAAVSRPLPRPVVKAHATTTQTVVVPTPSGPIIHQSSVVPEEPFEEQLAKAKSRGDFKSIARNLVALKSSLLEEEYFRRKQLYETAFEAFNAAGA